LIKKPVSREIKNKVQNADIFIQGGFAPTMHFPISCGQKQCKNTWRQTSTMMLTCILFYQPYCSSLI